MCWFGFFFGQKHTFHVIQTLLEVLTVNANYLERIYHVTLLHT